MDLSQKQQNFLKKRRLLIKLWVYAGPALLLGIGVFAYLLSIQTPYLINPLQVGCELQSGQISQTTLETMALLLPMMGLIIFFLMVVLVIMVYVALSNEKKYLAMLDQTEPTVENPHAQ